MPPAHSKATIISLPFGILTILAVLALTCCADLSADQLKSPWDGHPVALTDAEYTCPDPPPFSQSLDAEGYYIDAHHSVIDPVKKAAYEKAAEAPDHLGQWTTQAADDYLRQGSRAGVQCVYTLLSAAARAKAWSASMATGQAHYVQKWLLAGTAMAYLKVRNAGVGTPEQDKEIQKWFGLLADQVRELRRRQNEKSQQRCLEQSSLLGRTGRLRRRHRPQRLTRVPLRHGSLQSRRQ
jgi:poly(beta-D-mannuronate) lyase